MIFRILSSDSRVILEEYIREYLAQNPKAQLIIGCDSKNRDDETVYGLVVVLYKEKKGGHVLYAKQRVPRVRDISQKFLEEYQYGK